MAVIVLVGPRDQQMLAGDTRRARKPLEMEPPLERSVRLRPPDDRLDGRQVPLLEGDEERMAPDLAFRRNEQTEGRKPVLIDEMLKRHLRRIDGVIDIMDALLVRRIDAERMQSGPVLRGRNDLALRDRGRQASLVRGDRQSRRLIESDRNAVAGDWHRVAQPAAKIP